MIQAVIIEMLYQEITYLGWIGDLWFWKLYRLLELRKLKNRSSYNNTII